MTVFKMTTILDLPIECLAMIKSFSTNRDSLNFGLTCTLIYKVPYYHKKEHLLRRYNVIVYNNYKSALINSLRDCPHVACWEYCFRKFNVQIPDLLSDYHDQDTLDTICTLGNLKILKFVLGYKFGEKYLSKCDFIYSGNRFPNFFTLKMACSYGRFEVVRHLLSHIFVDGSYFTAKDVTLGDNSVILEILATGRLGSIERLYLLKFLLEFKFHDQTMINETICNKFQMLERACCHSNIDILKYLLNLKPNFIFNTHDVDTTVFRRICIDGKLEAIKYLLNFEFEDGKIPRTMIVFPYGRFQKDIAFYLECVTSGTVP